MSRRFAFGLSAAFLFLLTVSTSSQEIDFGQLPEQITKDLRRNGLDSAVVFVFRGPGTEETSLGLRLAEEFIAALRAAERPLATVDRTALEPLVAKHQVQADQIRRMEMACWLSYQVGARAVVAGFFELKGEIISLTVLGFDTWSFREVAKRKAKISADPSLRALAQVRLPPPPKPPAPSTSGESEAPFIAKSGIDAGYPVCIHCPNPQYTEEARLALISCTILLRVVVTKEGAAGDIQVARPCALGLTENAIATVRKWRFKPATRKDGTPVDAWAPIEINLRIYSGTGILP